MITRSVWMGVISVLEGNEPPGASYLMGFSLARIFTG